MSKIICEVCGSSYADTTVQCPVCGCVGSGGSHRADSGSYTYVKGGRFSKSNVRKRNTATAAASKPAASKSASAKSPAATKTGSTYKSGKNQGNSSNKGLVITAVVLFLLIIAVVVYIVVLLLQGKSDDKIQDSGNKNPSTVTVDSAQDDQTEDTTDQEEETNQKETDPEETQPEETEPEETEPKEQEGTFSFMTKSIELEEEQSKILYSGTVSLDKITWLSDDPSVATVERGYVYGKKAGTTTVYAKYNGTTLSCVVTVKAVNDDDYHGTDGNGGVSSEEEVVNQQSGQTNYYIDNLRSELDADFTLYLNNEAYNETKLALRDAGVEYEYGKGIEGVEWSVEDSSVCSVAADGTVVALATGITHIVAEYNGGRYTCTVRVGYDS